VTTRVAVTGAGGPSAVSFMNAVAERDVELIAGDIDPYAAGLYLVPPERRWILHRGADPRFVDDILARCAAAHVDVLVPTVDVELLPIAQRRAEFEAAGVKLLLSPAITLERCLDKWSLVEACREICPVPDTRIIDRDYNLGDDARPIFVKPRDRAGVRGARIVQHAEDFASVPRDGSYVAQEVLSGAEYSIDVLCDAQGNVLVAVPRSRLKLDAGIAVAERTVKNERLQALASAVARRLGVTFIANVQFREDDSGNPKLLDVDARCPETMPLTVMAGIDMPGLALDLALGKTVDPKTLKFREVAIVRTWRDHLVEPAEIAELEVRARDLATT
jgi:carbamoyl-phosphate synthase large subunit